MMTTEQRKPRRVAHVAKIVLFSLVPAIILIIVAETIATLSIGRRASTEVEPATGNRVYTMRVGRLPWSRRVATPLNSLGFPDNEFPSDAAPKTCTHVVFAGDSYTFGDGVDRDSNYVEIVRRRLADGVGGRCVRIFNISERGTTIDRQLRRILETMERLRPDVVILGQYQNDLTDLTAPGAILGPLVPPTARVRPRTILPQLPAFNLNIVKYLAYHSMAAMIQRGITRDELRHWSVVADTTRRAEAARLQQVYGRLYGQLVDMLRQRGIAFGTVIIPSKLDLLAARYPEEPFFTGLADRYRVPYLRLYPVLDAQRSPYAFLMYDGHLNEQGNRLVADVVLAWLRDREAAPFPVLHQLDVPAGESDQSPAT